ncbi:MAG: glycine cleavage system aminomethyltransferase GcvT [Gammaproteobacteria bacterium]|nr:glycine cleavage system aminomethyltransferase GcvT [Gammaproteobacteria bacterium]
MSQRTALYDKHLEAGAKMVDFAGWDMPIHYGSQIEEHKQVRQDAGMFDVSHMVIIDLEGAGSKAFLQKLLANDVDRLKDAGKALYSCMLNPQGGVIDDLIVYYLADGQYRIVVNAGTRDKDIAWMEQQIVDMEAELTIRDDLSMIAVQGPNARDKFTQTLSSQDAEAANSLKTFFGAQIGELFIARTGYTGEDGFEVMVPNEEAINLWQKLVDNGVHPCGLGARDTLRLEAGMNLYGTDMDEDISPLEAGLGWTIAWEPADRDFIGRSAIEPRRGAEDNRKFIGLVLEGRGVLRGHQKVILPDGSEGETTSGTFSPTLGQAIAMARVPASVSDQVEVEIRGKRLPAKRVKMPFVRNGKSLID